MLAKVNTLFLSGIDSEVIEVETDLARGLPSFNVVGLGGTAIKEAGERVRSAAVNSGFDYPRCRITVNLVPAGRRKEGSHFDLPIAIGILSACGAVPGRALGEFGIIGELSLDGRVNGVRGALSMIMGAAGSGLKKMIVPAKNAGEAGMAEGIDIYPVKDLRETVEFLAGRRDIPIYNRKKKDHRTFCAADDFADVTGQETAKRAMVICAAGAHGLLMMGSPGSGKTMMARRLPGILPSMTHEERLDVARIYSVAGMLDQNDPEEMSRPFRSPHHSITVPALIGGGRRPMPGELSLAHCGVLFLDEMALFDSRTLEALRQPLEDGYVNIIRQEGKVRFPARTILVAASNPCRCGYAGDPSHECTCTSGQISDYMNKLSGPVIDRIDMHIRVGRVKTEEIAGKKERENISSAEMRLQVEEARKIQLERFKNENIFFNSAMSAHQIEKYCPLGRNEKELITAAYEKLSMSMRTYKRMIKLSRTIADLQGSSEIKTEHLAEAMQYRDLTEYYRRN